MRRPGARTATRWSLDYGPHSAAARRAAAAVADGDFAAFRDAVVGADSTADAWAAYDAARRPPADVPQPAGRWRAEHPDDPVAATLWGLALTEAAWDLRSSQRAAAVSEDRFEGFRIQLEYADAELRRAAWLDPASAVPWTGLVTTARGLGREPEVARRRYEQAVARGTGSPFVAAADRLQHLCEKWHGSHDEMFAFARSSTDAVLGALVALAHFEYHARLVGAERLAHLRAPVVVEEVAARGAALLAAEPGAGDDEAVLRAHNAFALVLALANRHELARRHLDAAGGRVTRLPWIGVAGPVEIVERIRRTGPAR